LNFTILYLQILEYKNNEKVYNKNFWLADYCYVVLSAINFRPTLPFVQGIFDVFCYTKKNEKSLVERKKGQKNSFLQFSTLKKLFCKSECYNKFSLISFY